MVKNSVSFEDSRPIEVPETKNRVIFGWQKFAFYTTLIGGSVLIAAVVACSLVIY